MNAPGVREKALQGLKKQAIRWENRRNFERLRVKTRHFLTTDSLRHFGVSYLDQP